MCPLCAHRQHLDGTDYVDGERRKTGGRVVVSSVAAFVIHVTAHNDSEWHAAGGGDGHGSKNHRISHTSPAHRGGLSSEQPVHSTCDAKIRGAWSAMIGRAMGDNAAVRPAQNAKKAPPPGKG
jgi:hypothetical protein